MTPLTLNGFWKHCSWSEAPALGVGSRPILHQGSWFARDPETSRPMRFWGLGTLDPSYASAGNVPQDLSTAAQNVINNASMLCQGDPSGSVAQFQSTYNLYAFQAIANSGVYDAATAAALTETANLMGVSGAPPACTQASTTGPMGGRPSSGLISAATALVSATNNSATVSAFQTAFNAEYSPAIKVDGAYGPETQGALDQVIGDANSKAAGTFNTTAPAFTTSGAKVDINTATAALIDYFNNNSCGQNSVPEVAQFQAAFNSAAAAGQFQGSLSVNGQYDGNTQSAVQAVLNSQGGQGATAPSNCFQGTSWGNVPTTPGPDPTRPPMGATPGAATDWTPWIVGGLAVLAVGGLVYYMSQRKPRRAAHA